MLFGLLTRKRGRSGTAAPRGADAIDLLQAHVDGLWQRTSRHPLTRIQRRPQGDGSLYVEFHDQVFDVVCEERGVECWRERSLSRDDAAFLLIFGQASFICGKEEAELRVSGDDKVCDYSRWNWMYPTIQAMTAISANFGDRASADYKGVLLQAPLDSAEIANSRFPIPSGFLPAPG